jgi:hypothetical protein
MRRRSVRAAASERRGRSILLVEAPVAEAVQDVRAGRIADAKTLRFPKPALGKRGSPWGGEQPMTVGALGYDPGHETG